MDGGRTLTYAEREAVAAFPELRRLIDLRDGGGWLFLPSSDRGELREMHGVRTYPEGYADAVRVRSGTDAAAVRTDHEGYRVWWCEGGLVEVVDALLAVPDPSQPNAPKLARGSATSMLWTP